ncbi:MAG TPA: bifunctional rhamnulose-1-phosphate aldolase/short-chain dehydrogenase, partial [bacterium]
MSKRKLVYLEDKWDHNLAKTLDEPEKLRYRSNLLGSDLRITNFGGGNTSSKIMREETLTSKPVEVLWVKGSGGDLGSIKRTGFATLYMDRFLALKEKYRGEKYEDEMLTYYPLCTFGLNPAPASIDTPLHGLVPFKHVDHTHPDWAIALAASANGRLLLDRFNQEFGYHLLWLPWQRPGYHLGTILENAIKENPQAEGIILGSHGLLNWANEQYDCYRLSIEIIDAMGQFVLSRVEKKGRKLFGGARFQGRDDRQELAAEILPVIRGGVGKEQRMIGHFVDLSEVQRFANSEYGEKLAFQGTSCPDHFIRTKVRPMYVKWDPQRENLETLKRAVTEGFEKYHVDYKSYYNGNKEPDSPAMRGANPTVVLIPGVGMFSFGKNKTEARITGEFYVNAIHVMEGATSMGSGEIDDDIDPKRVCENYVALSRREAFRIEYWALEEAKIRRQPPEKEMARQVAFVVGGGNGIGREFCLKIAKEGAHVAVADLDSAAATETARLVADKFGPEAVMSVRVDITNRQTVASALKEVVMKFGGVDALVNTAAVFIAPDKDGTTYHDSTWDKTLQINVSSNYILVEEFARIVEAQGSGGTVVLTSSANAVVPKLGSEPYDVSKAAVSHLIRELAVRYAPLIRINGISPATVIEGSTMFPRDRVIKSLSKYNIKFDESEETSALIDRLANFYASRTLTHRPVRPVDV